MTRATKQIRLLGTMICFLLVVGCAVRSTQLESLRRIVSTVGASNDAAEYAWEFEFNGAGYTVYPVSDRDGVVSFANAEGLRIIWDGNVLVAINGLPGSVGHIRIESQSDGRRLYPLGDGQSRSLSCGPRRNWQLTPARAGWRQDCVDGSNNPPVSSIHEVEFDGAGSIRIIRATLILGAPPATLRRLSP